jgi:hypothetical protein
MTEFWTRMAGRGPAEVIVAGTAIGPGSRVRLRPRSQADIFDLVLDGCEAIVESVEQSDDGALHVAVTLAGDPGRDLGEARMPGHRFFYSAAEIEPLGEHEGRPAGGRILVAGIGNVFLGDDGFGVEVARLLVEQACVPGVDVVDFGIRGMDLAYALQRDYTAVIFVDAAPRGHAPGTLTVLDPDLPGDDDGAGGGARHGPGERATPGQAARPAARPGAGRLLRARHRGRGAVRAERARTRDGRRSGRPSELPGYGHDCGKRRSELPRSATAVR